MGLDVTAYRKVKYGEVPRIDEEDEEDELRVWKNPDFPERATDVPDKRKFEGEGIEDYISYPYSAHMKFRDQLARLWGHPPEDFLAEWYQSDDIDHRASQHEPFWELIWFSDCEGVLGPSDCAALLEDFRSHRERFAVLNQGDPFALGRYDTWTKLVEAGADSGLVTFG